MDKLDPSKSFVGQLRQATKQLDETDNSNFKNVQDSLIRAKKDKLTRVREAQKMLAARKQQEEEAIAEALRQEKLAKMQKNKKTALSARERMQ